MAKPEGVNKAKATTANKVLREISTGINRVHKELNRLEARSVKVLNRDPKNLHTR